MIDRWKRLRSRSAEDYRIFRTRRDLYRNPRDGSTREYVVIESPDWINVVPVTDAGRVVLIRQYRHGIESPTLEIPVYPLYWVLAFGYAILCLALVVLLARSLKETVKG